MLARLLNDHFFALRTELHSEFALAAVVGTSVNGVVCGAVNAGDFAYR